MPFPQFVRWMMSGWRDQFNSGRHGTNVEWWYSTVLHSTEYIHFKLISLKSSLHTLLFLSCPSTKEITDDIFYLLKTCMQTKQFNTVPYIGGAGGNLESKNKILQNAECRLSTRLKRTQRSCTVLFDLCLHEFFILSGNE